MRQVDRLGLCELQQAGQAVLSPEAGLFVAAQWRGRCRLQDLVDLHRAGEQGRGFVVVANEVRALAQRTADAAKDVKLLILASVHSVEQGRHWVEQAGQGMQRIVASAQEVTQAIDQISGVMVSQSEGISEVGEAVGEVDRLTQQNAALVEQSAAAAASLSAQARRLSQAVSVFRVTSTAGG